ncbi:MAG: flagellar type III secretion system pore protein FliP [bacterium]|nr:flagellar type III secretion system pore protein FliP [bacterium]
MASFLVFSFKPAFSQHIPIPKIDIGITEAKGPREVTLALQILFLLTILTLAPSIVIMLTSFIRIMVVLSFVRRALATQEMPPQQVIVALALFLTFFIMAPTISKINKEAVQPYLQGKFTLEQALSKAIEPIREFMFRYTREKDIALFMKMGDLGRPANREDVPTYTLIPAFMISELSTGFRMGILLFIPFLVLDMVVASTLMSMGMIMLPPVMVSLPFKILLFVLVDGWHLITRSLVLSYH